MARRGWFWERVLAERQHRARFDSPDPLDEEGAIADRIDAHLKDGGTVRIGMRGGQVIGPIYNVGPYESAEGFLSVAVEGYRATYSHDLRVSDISYIHFE